MIPTVKEPKELYGNTILYEKCHFCKKNTDTWHWRTNQPVCTKCAKMHKVAELPKCTTKYKVLTKEQYLNFNNQKSDGSKKNSKTNQ